MMKKKLSRLFKKLAIVPEAKNYLEIISDDQEMLDGARLALHDICLKYEAPEIDSLVHEAWRQLTGKLMSRLEGRKF